LRYATEDLEWLERNPWERLDIPYKTTSKRRPWTEAELNTFFSQDLHTQYKLPRDNKAGADAAYWIPLLGIYTGARIGELAQLPEVKSTVATMGSFSSSYGSDRKIHSNSAFSVV
jgi:integrase